MAISKYSELTAAIGTYTDRDDLTAAQLADIVQMAEVFLNAELPISALEATTTLTGTTSSRNLTLPADYVLPITLELTTWSPSYTRLRAATPDNILYSDTNAPPSAFIIEAGVIKLNCPCDQAHTFLFRYRQKLALDSTDSDDTNTLLTNAPNIYLFAALAEAYRLIQSFEKVSAWETQRDRAIASRAWQEQRSKSIAPLVVDRALTARGGFDINSGD